MPLANVLQYGPSMQGAVGGCETFWERSKWINSVVLFIHRRWLSVIFRFWVYARILLYGRDRRWWSFIHSFCFGSYSNFHACNHIVCQCTDTEHTSFINIDDNFNAIISMQSKYYYLIALQLLCNCNTFQGHTSCNINTRVEGSTVDGCLQAFNLLTL